jgi:predicted permease
MSTRISRVFNNLRALVRGRRRDDAELSDELRAYLDAAIDAKVAAGMTRADAERAARVELGSAAAIRDRVQDIGWSSRIDGVRQDVRYAWRGLRRAPGFTAAAVSMLAIGLGLVIGGYAVVNGLFFRGWNVPESARVFTVSAFRSPASSTGYVDDGFTYGAYRHVHDHAAAGDYVAWIIEYFRIRPNRETSATFVPGLIVSDNFIETTRIPLQLGTGFVGMSGPQPSIVISDKIWRRVFDADPHVVGRTAWVGDVAVTIAGVTAVGFSGLRERALDVVVGATAASLFGPDSDAGRMIENSATCCISLAGRLRAGATIAQASEELIGLVAQYRRAMGQPALTVVTEGTAPGLSSLDTPRGRTLVLTLALVAVGVVLVLLLTCANVGNLHLARCLRREREIAVRLAIGASRPRIVRQLLTEGLVLAAIAGTAALLMTAGVPLAIRFIEDDPMTTMFASDWRVVAFTVLVVVLTCLVVSLAPALQTTRINWRGVSSALSARTGRTRQALLATQIAIATVLVLSATLVARGIQHASTSPKDFALDTTTTATLEAPAEQPLDDESRERIQAALARAADQSGLRIGFALGMTDRVGLGTSIHEGTSEIHTNVRLVPLSAAAFDVLNLRLVRGRLASDDPAAGEAVVNERLARLLAPPDEVLGRVFTLDFDRHSYQVVGVARDAHLTAFDEVEPMVHVPPTLGLPALLMRDEPGIEPRVKAIAASIDPSLKVTFAPLSRSLMRSLDAALVGAGIAGGIGLVALLLAIIGIFGVFSYLTEERRQEIGIRLALGASRAQVGLALLRASRTAIVGGLGVGLSTSLLASLVLRRFLFGLSPLDPISYVLVAIMLLVAAFLATAIPIRRATRVDPVIALRTE